ncbi:MAG: SIMPL domain-containing protein [Anaerolineales bacterium]
MINQEQLIQNPFGINVFGSSIIRVEPDVVSLNFAVSRTQEHPKDAFKETREASQNVRKYLEQAKIDGISTSRISISQTYKYVSGEQKFIGYTAKVVFHVLLHQLDQMEELLTGLVDAGVNELQDVEFQTTKLKEIRADARRQAIGAAREKAENYCTAAGVDLGKVIHIEDVNPDNLTRRDSHADLERASRAKAFDAGSITVSAAVIVAFKIK